MIPAGGDQSFYNNYKKSEDSAFREAATFRRAQNKTDSQVRQEQANPTTSPGEKRTEIQKRKGGRKNRPTSGEILRYPYDIMNEESDFLQIQIKKYNPPGIDGGNFGIKDLEDFSYIDYSGEKPKRVYDGSALEYFNVPDGTSANTTGNIEDLLETIFLPIPKNISDNNEIKWGGAGVNALEAFGLKFGQDFINTGPLEAARVAFEAGQAAFGDAKFSSDIRTAFINTVSAQAISALGGQVRPGDLISRATGQVLNPNLELLFENVTLRSFKFSFEFFPRNRKEAEVVMKIIRCFKTHSAPKKNGGIFLSAPDIFQLSYRKGSNPHPFLNTFKPTVLTNVNVNYTASNVYSTFYDGTPTHMIMELSFKELNPIYEENYYEEEQFVGPLANPDEAVTTPPTGGVGY